MPSYTGIQADESCGQGDSLTGSGPLPWSEVWVRRKRPKLTYYLAAIIAFILVDTPWLLIWSRSLGHMYQRIQGEPLKFKPAAAIPVYLAMSFLVSRPNCKVEAFMMGLCCYAVHEWTNYSTLSKYSLAFAIADTFWGGVLTLTVYSILSHRRVTKPSGLQSTAVGMYFGGSYGVSSRSPAASQAGAMEAGVDSGAERESLPKRTQSEPLSSSTASGWALHPSADPGSSMFESNCFYNLGRCLSEQQDDAPGPRSSHDDTAPARLSASAPAPHPSRLRCGQELDDSLVLLSIRERDIDSDRRAMLDSHESVSSQDERSRSMCDLPVRTPAAPTSATNIPRPPPVNVSGYMTASTLAGLPSPTDVSYTYGSASSSTSVPSPLESVRRLDLSSYEAGDLAALSIATSNLAEDMVESSVGPAVAAPASSSSSPESPSTPLGWLRHTRERLHGVAAAVKTGFANLVEATAETVWLLRGAKVEPAIVLGSSTTSITTTPVTPPPSQRARFRFPGRVDNMQWPEGSGVKRVTWWLVGLAIGCCVVFLLVPTSDPSVSWETRAGSGANGGKKGKAPSQPPSTTFGFGSRPSKAKMSKPVLNAPAPSASPPPSSSASSSSSTVPSPSASASLSPPPARSYMFFDSSMKDFHEFLTGPRRGWGTGINTDDVDDLPGGGVRDSNNTYSSSSSKDRRATRHILRVRLVYTTFKNACTALWNATGGIWHLATQALCGVLLRLLNHFPFIQPITRRFC